MKALVIGGTSAIGKGIIEKFHNNGYEILFTYNSNVEKAKEIAQQYGDSVNYQMLDLSNSDAVLEFTESLKTTFVPDVLINVAGITNDGLSFGDVHETLSLVNTVNFMSPATISAKAAELMMQNRRGHIINVSSVAAKTPKTGNAAYGSAKAALERFTASLAIEVARFKVRTLNIAPAFVDTPMFNAFAQGNERQVIRSLPLREILSVEDIANAAISFANGNIKTTGATLALTNGQSIL